MTDPIETSAARPRDELRRRSHLLSALLTVVLVVGLAVAGGTNVLDTVAQEATPPAETGSTVDDDAGGSIADIAEAANPAVVTVRAGRDLPVAFDDGFGQPSDPFFPGEDDPFDEPGVVPAPDEQLVPTSSGSGFIVDEAGHVVTNAHVVAGATEFEVELYDGTVVPATLVGADAFSDVAVLALDLADGQAVPGVLPLGDSDAVRVGDQVIAIGTPLGEYTNTVSAGIVGAKDRSLDTGAGYRLDGLIQHDAPVYQGNSGGPLLNLNGEVVGINTAKAASTLIGTDDPDIGFAVGINSVKDVIDELIADGEVARPYLGIEGRPLTEGHGVLQVDADSPAAVAGLERGDVITAVDGQAVDAEHPLANLLYDHAPGDSVTLTVERDGEELQLSVTLGERPTDA